MESIELNSFNKQIYFAKYFSLNTNLDYPEYVSEYTFYLFEWKILNTFDVNLIIYYKIPHSFIHS